MIQTRKRTVYLDFIRIIAIYMVLFNHTEINGFVLFTVRRNSFFYPYYLFNAILIKPAVPLFFMVSGALLLGKEESYSKIIKRFFRFLCVLLVASIVNYVFYYAKQSSFSLKEFLCMVYTKPVSGALWYMYAYLAYILMLPFLRCLAKNMDTEAFYWLFFMCAIMSLFPIIEFIICQGKYQHDSDFSFFVNVNYCLYPLMGYFIEHRLRTSDFNNKRLITLVTASVVSISICAILTHWKCTIMGEWKESTCQTFFNSLIFIPSGTLFFGAKMLFEKHTPNDRICHLISTVGSATFGLYLIEKICRSLTEKIFVFFDSFLPALLACWIWIFIACALGITITLLLKKIRFISKYI